MLESLDINGRVYLACDRAALEVGYAASYIERLARGKWIDASFVHGQCFVDLASLEAFITASTLDQTEQLRSAAERERAEAAWLAYELRTRALPEPQQAWFIAGQVGVITMCGLLLSLLTFSAVQAEITWDEIATGVSQSASVLRERVALPAGSLWPMLQVRERKPAEPEEASPTFAPEVQVKSKPDGRHELRVLE